MQENPGLSISLSKFYKLCPKNYKKAKKLTDVCQICETGKKMEKKLAKLLVNGKATPHAMELLREQVSYFKQHLLIKNEQKRLYDESVERTSAISCVIVMDFKENFKIGGGPVETGKMFFEKSQISLLGFAVLYRNEDNKKCIKYFNFLSKILSHDSLYATDCISQLMDHPFMKQFKEFCFWSDSGPHFRSGEMAHFFFEELYSKYVDEKKIFLNYFAEYHGKSLVDGHFGLLSRWFLDGESNRNIRTLEDLKEYFELKIAAQISTNCNRPLSAEFLIYERNHGRGIVKFITFFWSFFIFYFLFSIFILIILFP